MFQGFSVSLWLNIHSYPATQPSQHTFFMAAGVSVSRFYLKTYTSENGQQIIQFIVSDSRPGAAKFISRLDDNIAVDTWNHFIFTYKFTNPADHFSHFTAYVNGSPGTIGFAAAYQYINDTFSYSPMLLTGNQDTGVDSELSVDDISIYDGVLSAAHALELYQLY